MDSRVAALLVVLGYVLVLESMVAVLVRTVFRTVEAPRPLAVARLVALAGFWLLLVVGLGYLAFGVYPIGELR